MTADATWRGNGRPVDAADVLIVPAARQLSLAGFRRRSGRQMSPAAAPLASLAAAPYLPLSAVQPDRKLAVSDSPPVTICSHTPGPGPPPEAATGAPNRAHLERPGSCDAAPYTPALTRPATSADHSWLLLTPSGRRSRQT